MDTVGTLKTDSPQLNFKGMCAAMKYQLKIVSKGSTTNRDVESAYPFFESAMAELRKPREAAADEAPAAAVEAADADMRSWLRDMITAEHAAMAVNTSSPRTSIRHAIEQALVHMYDRTLRVALLWRPWTASPVSPGVYGAVVLVCAGVSL